MPLDIAKFNSAFGDARHRQRTEPDYDVTAAQNELREPSWPRVRRQ